MRLEREIPDRDDRASSAPSQRLSSAAATSMALDDLTNTPNVSVKCLGLIIGSAITKRGPKDVEAGPGADGVEVAA